VTQDGKPVIVRFLGGMVGGPCKMIAPLLDEIAREKADAVKVAKLRRREPEPFAQVQYSRDSGFTLFQERPIARSSHRRSQAKKDLLNRIEALA